MGLPRIIGVTGFARHGKDTVGSVLVKELGYNRFALADKMKEALLVLNPIVNSYGLHLADAVAEDGWEYVKNTYTEARRLLQVFGTQVGRNMIGEDVWIEVLAKSVKGFYSDAGPRIVIPDVRFLNEARFIRRMRGEVWKVYRPDFDNGLGDAALHDSERDIPAIVPDMDALFVNDQDEQYLKDQVFRYLKVRRYMSFAALDSA